MPALAVFIDGGYIESICNEHFDGVRVDYRKLGAEIQRMIEERSSGSLEHLRTYYYTCPPYQGDPPTAEERRLLSGYHSAGHWHETRSVTDPASGAPEDLRRRFADLLAEREGLVGRSWVQLTNAHWPD